MKKIKKYACEVLAVLLTCAVLLNDGSIMTVLASNVNDAIQQAADVQNASADSAASENSGDVENPAPDDGNEEDPAPDDGDGEDPNPDDGDGEDPNPDDGDGEVSNPDDGDGEDPNPDNGDGEDPNPDDGDGEDPNPDDRDGEDPNPDDGNEEDPDLEEENPEEEHTHTWIREEDSLFPVCSECEEIYYDDDCISEEAGGMGIHIFELIREEGQEDKYRCAVCGYEKEFLEEWELTLEIYMQLTGAETYSLEYNGEISYFPTTIAELEQVLGDYEYKRFEVTNLADLLALQSLSQDGFDFKDWTVRFAARQNPDGTLNLSEWDLRPLAGRYVGLGTEEAPFRGTMTNFYVGNSVQFMTSTPLLNYVATGATVSHFQIDANINGTGEPVGIIASHLVKDGDSDQVNLEDLILTGTVKNTGGSAGVFFGEADAGSETLIINYPADDHSISKVTAAVSAKNAGGIVGKTFGKVEIYDTNPITTGTITGSESAGMLAGSMENGGRLCIQGADSRTITAAVSGNGTSGGLAGIIREGEILRLDGDGTLTIGGSVSGRVAAGGVVGLCEDTRVNIKNLQIGTAISGYGTAGSIVGGVIGKFQSHRAGDLTAEFDLIDQVTVTGDVGYGSFIGGIAGEINGSNIRIGQSGSVKVTGRLNYTGLNFSGVAMGGIAGTVSGQYIEVNNGVISSNTMNYAYSLGGVFGVVGDGTERSVVRVNDVSVNVTAYQFSPYNFALGGIFGTVKANSMAALDGNVNVNFNTGHSLSATQYLKIGYIAGEQTEALIYFEEGAVYTRQKKGWQDDIGTYGGVYRNGSWGESSPLISYAEKEVTGIVGKSGDEWVLDSEADVIRLAIALNTEGRFAGNCLGADKSVLLGGTYRLTGKIYDLSESGIYSLNRNDSNGKNQVFSGQFLGNGAHLWLGSYDTYQGYIALFPRVGDGAVFENFTLEGKDHSPRTIQYARTGSAADAAAAGLAAYGQNDVTVRGVAIHTAITGSTLNVAYRYGGLIAEFSAGPGTALKVEDSSLGGSIKISQSSSYTNKQYAGGMIAWYNSTAQQTSIQIDGLDLNWEISSSSRFASGMITQLNGSASANQDKTILRINDIRIGDDSSLNITDNTSISSMPVIIHGGLLGREWFDVVPYKDENESYSIMGLTVGTGAVAAPVFRVSGGTFGGMIHTVTGRLQLVDTTINGITVSGTGSNNALLINDGNNALIEIDGYIISPTDKVSLNGGANFSEIVGRNRGTDGNGAYTSGGIVNIISEEFANSSQVYKNQRLMPNVKSGEVRYYYNLFGTDLSKEDSFLPEERKLDGANLVIRDADQMMIWHLNQYMTESIRKRYLAPYFAGEVPARNGNVTIQETINLENRSYYPTPVSSGITINGGGAEVIFNAAKIEDKADEGRRPSQAGEHYMMHSGLLLSRTGTVTVQGNMDADTPGNDDYLTLSGTVSNVGANSGALFSGEISGKKNIYRINLKNLYIYNYAASHVHGLLIGKITDVAYGSSIYGSSPAAVDMSWIKTEYTSAGKKAASALIGRVGDPDGSGQDLKGSRKINIEFTNMSLDDQKSGIFQNATFIDQYYYTDDTELNEGRVRYLFTEAAAEGNLGDPYPPFNDSVHGRNQYPSSYITIGNELKYGVEYWDAGVADLGVSDWAAYLPYVCDHTDSNSKEIEVNPKAKDILKGCGTYEDPYVLEHPKQLLALSRYLTRPTDKKYLEGWQINRIGTNDTFCNGTDDEHTAVTYDTTGFPTQDELRQAYYLIAEDIDLSNLTYTTDRNIAQEFVGLGTEEKPFTGVIVGRKADGGIPIITLPKKNNNNNTANFGFVQYAKGAVVKDLVIAGNSEKVDVTDPDYDREKNLTDIIRVKENGGAVFTCVLGGDNIIDNVKVSNRISPVSGDAVAGGLVGTVRQGSVILRNMPEDAVKDFQCLTKEGTPIYPVDYPYISGVIGKVENGFVVYDKAGTDSLVLDHAATSITGVYQHAYLPLSKTYDLVVTRSAEMTAAKNSPMNITSSGDQFSCRIGTAAQLQIVSMAINSDAFSVYYDGGGYDKNAICRKAMYSDVGNCSAINTDYLAATKRDDATYWYPYIYDYFTFGGVKASDSSSAGTTGFFETLENYSATDGKTGCRSKLNAVTKDVSARMSYSLVNGGEDVDYDLSGYCRAFRGLGATYRVYDPANGGQTVVYSDFRADFDGNGATVKAEMINDYDKNIHTIALFNDLFDVYAQNAYTIQNLVVTGTFQSFMEETMGNQAYQDDRAAAVIGMMRRPWTFRNITAKNVTVNSQGHAAGIAAWINPGYEKEGEEKSYLFEGCKVTGGITEATATSITTVGGSCGGILGVMTSNKKINKIDNIENILNVKLVLKDCKVSGASGSPVEIINEGKGILESTSSSSDQYRTARGRTGGLIGYVGKRARQYTNDSDENKIRFIVDLQITDSGSEPTVAYTRIEGVDSTGGILGEYFGFSHSNTNTMILDKNVVTVNISKVKVFESSITSKDRNESLYNSFGVGGIIGKVGRLTGCSIENVQVLNTDVRSIDESKSSHTTLLPAGGVVGALYPSGRLTIKATTVEGKVAGNVLQNEISSFSYDAGGLLGRCIYDGGITTSRANTSVDIENCTVRNMKVLSDNRTEDNKNDDKASGTSTGSVGGMAGSIDCATASVKGSNKIENCIVRTGKGGNSGGVFGQACGWGAYTIEGVEVKGSRIGYNSSVSKIESETIGAGGIIGRANTGNGTMQRVKVTSCDVFGRNAGGLIGYVYYCNQVGNIWKAATDDITISDNNIFGKNIGGAIGYLGISVSKTCFEHVTIENNHILALWNAANGMCYAGGFIGYQAGYNSNNHYNQIHVKGNQIMGCNNVTPGSQSVGGIVGYLDRQNSYRLYAYETLLEDNHIGYYPATQEEISNCLAENKEDQLNRIHSILEDLGTDGKNAQLLYEKNNAVSTMNGMPDAEELQKNLIDYAKCTGNFVGNYNNSYNDNFHAYFINPTVTYTDAYTGVRPVIDVGYGTKGTAGNALLDNPYAYRRNIHIIYFAPDTGVGNDAAAAWGTTASDRNRLFSQINMKAAVEAYQEAMSSTGTAQQVLDAYRLNIVNDNSINGKPQTIEDIYDQVYYGVAEGETAADYRSAIKANGKTLPMVVLDARYGTADQLMNGVLAMLTGSGGVLNSGETGRNSVYDAGLGEITSISLQPMQVQNGNISSSSGAASLGFSQNNSSRRGFVYTKHYDQVDSNGNGTFTMVTITYGNGTYSAIAPVDGAAETKTRPDIEIKIPVFVIERLPIDTYIKLVEGAAYNVASAKEKGICFDPMLATDSSYTMYVEYIYGDARKRFSSDTDPIRIDKTVSMTGADGGNVPFAKGTILTLIDVCDSNKVYYYEVTGKETGPIHYSDFVDPDAGNAPYQNKPIHKDVGFEIHSGSDTFTSKDYDASAKKDVEITYQDVAVEKFLLVVDVSRSDMQEEGTGSIRKYHATPQLEENLQKRTDLTEHTTLEVAIQRGPEIGLVDGTVCISGAVDEQEKLIVNGQFQVQADYVYWLKAVNRAESLIDSANHGKFLELGLYLTAPDGERIPLPNNTNVSIYLDRVNPYGQVIQPDKNLGAYNNETAVYLYKDGKLQFPLDELRELIKAELDGPSHTTNGNVKMSFKIELNFEFADLTDYVLERGEMYGVHLELLRAEDADYPADGEVMSSYSGNCSGAKQSDLACVLETLDLMQLGINTYDNQTVGEQQIDFEFKLDFNGVWANNTDANKEIADKYYTVTYRILEKTNRNGNPVYKPYLGDQLEIELADNQSQSGIDQILTAGSSSVGNEINTRYVTYQFAYDEIKDGTNAEAERVITRDLRLKVKNAAGMDLTNYKIQASVVTSDTEPHDIDSEVNRALSDFFVFTIAKLKTDLDY